MLFALCVQLVFKQGDTETKNDIQPLQKNFSKTPTTTLLRELQRHVSVNAVFERTLLDFIDRRHTLIHRWGIEHGLPEDAAGQEKITLFCQRLTNDAVGLFTVLNRYMVEWMRKFPEFADDPGAEAALRLLPIPEHLWALTIDDGNGE